MSGEAMPSPLRHMEPKAPWPGEALLASFSDTSGDVSHRWAQRDGASETLKMKLNGTYEAQ